MQNLREHGKNMNDSDLHIKTHGIIMNDEEWVRSSAGERFLHTEEVAGSIPAAPTRMGVKTPIYILVL